jgi:hypothetical protein
MLRDPITGMLAGRARFHAEPSVNHVSALTLKTKEEVTTETPWFTSVSVLNHL